jgi:hypothetical protein
MLLLENVRLSLLGPTLGTHPVNAPYMGRVAYNALHRVYRQLQRFFFLTGFIDSFNVRLPLRFGVAGLIDSFNGRLPANSAGSPVQANSAGFALLLPGLEELGLMIHSGWFFMFQIGKFGVSLFSHSA